MPNTEPAQRRYSEDLDDVDLYPSVVAPVWLSSKRHKRGPCAVIPDHAPVALARQVDTSCYERSLPA
ncbi:hypothetical protein [Gordonia sp. MP11Mi]|uniref:Uncharacterized protein n=1 Tax=Gordonia sp. MP11Mi TaxID=3022769 RepID=A0AA97GTL3_9ACTN